jgi:hypothetical protein
LSSERRKKNGYGSITSNVIFSHGDKIAESDRHHDVTARKAQMHHLPLAMALKKDIEH